MVRVSHLNTVGKKTNSTSSRTKAVSTTSPICVQRAKHQAWKEPKTPSASTRRSVTCMAGDRTWVKHRLTSVVRAISHQSSILKQCQLATTRLTSRNTVYRRRKASREKRLALVGHHRLSKTSQFLTKVRKSWLNSTRSLKKTYIISALNWKAWMRIHTKKNKTSLMSSMTMLTKTSSKMVNWWESQRTIYLHSSLWDMKTAVAHHSWVMATNRCK